MPILARDTLKFMAVASIGVILRYILIMSSYQSSISERVEASTPVTSWKRATEGVHLLKLGISPYSGDTFHEMPILLYFYHFIQTSPMITPFIDWIFIFADVITALILSMTSFIYILDMAELEHSQTSKLAKKEDRKLLTIDTSTAISLSLKVAAFYLLSPFSILACAARSTALFTNLTISVMILAASCNLRTIAVCIAAFLTYQSFHSLVLLAPIVMILEHQRVKTLGEQVVDYCDKSTRSSVIWSLMLFTLALVSFFGVSYYSMNESWQFLETTYLFEVTVLDLTPNIGIYWYFFTEVFDHFRTFFLWTFHINSFIYTLPLAVKFRSNAYVFMMVQLILHALLRPYPSISDSALYLAMIPIFSHLLCFMKQGLFIGGCLITCSILAPIMWHLWIVTGTANANFYFGVVLAANVGQILLVTDLLFAHTKREFYIRSGGVLRDENGNPTKLALSYS